MPQTTVPRNFNNAENVPPVPRPDTEEALQPRLFPAEFAPDRTPHQMAELYGGLGSKEDVERELDGIAAAIRSFHGKRAEQVFEECSAYSARLSELYVLLHRMENSPFAREFYRVRTQQVEIFRNELEFQFKLASRRVEIDRQQITIGGGGA